MGVQVGRRQYREGVGAPNRFIVALSPARKPQVFDVLRGKYLQAYSDARPPRTNRSFGL